MSFLIGRLAIDSGGEGNTRMCCVFFAEVSRGPAMGVPMFAAPPSLTAIAEPHLARTELCHCPSTGSILSLDVEIAIKVFCGRNVSTVAKFVSCGTLHRRFGCVVSGMDGGVWIGCLAQSLSSVSLRVEAEQRNCILAGAQTPKAGCVAVGFSQKGFDKRKRHTDSSAGVVCVI